MALLHAVTEQLDQARRDLDEARSLIARAGKTRNPTAPPDKAGRR
jgi:hypothetical protein